MPRRKYDAQLEVWKKAVKLRDDYTCQVCGRKDRQIQAAHIIPEEFKERLYDTMNGVTLCVTNHIFGKESAHKNPIWFSEWLRKNKYEQWVHAVKFINKEV